MSWDYVRCETKMMFISKVNVNEKNMNVFTKTLNVIKKIPNVFAKKKELESYWEINTLSMIGSWETVIAYEEGYIKWQELKAAEFKSIDATIIPKSHWIFGESLSFTQKAYFKYISSIRRVP